MCKAQSRPLHRYIEVVAAVTANITRFQLWVDSDRPDLSEVFSLGVMALVDMRARRMM
jgi:hypothetical protein